jgi:hypothetical protein
MIGRVVIQNLNEEYTKAIEVEKEMVVSRFITSKLKNK